jgi:hypothetical protein
MTGQLRTTFDTRADDLGTWEVDLESIVCDGDRRIRRRRMAIAGGLAGVLAVVGGMTALAGRDHTSRAQPTEAPLKPLTYAVGSVIHSDHSTIDVGKDVESFVPTHWGFVFSTPDRRLYQERDGQVQPIVYQGHPTFLADASARLVVSDDGLLTAWWDGTRIQTWPGYGGGDDVVGLVDAFDKTNSFSAAGSWPSDDPPRIQAAADGHLWFWDGHDPWIAEVRPMTTTAGWKDSNPPGSGTVVDAAGDQVLVHVADGMAVTTANLLKGPASNQEDWTLGGDLADLKVQVPGVTSGDLAPDGKHWFGEDTGRFTVYDSDTGQAHEIATVGYPSATPYQWLGNDTIAAVALDPNVDGSGSTPVNLLVCHVSTSSCVVAAKNVGNEGNVVLSDGRPDFP